MRKLNGLIVLVATGIFLELLTGNLPARAQAKPNSFYPDRETGIINEPIFVKSGEKMTLVQLHQNIDKIAQSNLQVLEEVLEVVNTLEEPEAKARLLTEIAMKFAGIAQEERAQTLLTDALIAANDIEEDSVRVRAKTAIASAYFQLGQAETAADLLSDALATANNLDDSGVKSSLLAEIALTYDTLGFGDRSLAILSESRDIARDRRSAESAALFPFEPTGWEGQVGLGASFFSGDKITSETTFNFALERQWPTDEVNFRISFTNDYDDSRVPPEDDNQIKGQIDAEYRHHATERYQYFISSLVRRDEPDGIDVRTNLYTGPGINIWRAGPDRSFDMQLGLGIRYEDSNRRRDDLDFPVAQYRMRYKDVYFDFLTLRQFFTFELPFDDLEDYYIESSTTLRIPIIQGWSFNNNLILRYASNPSLDDPNLRVDFVTGIEYQF
ncbi:putative salt-induced outer membrane protein [Oscillatoria acuminata PCC 6304]|uniref:Putative salt-induced outer membrane protein n=1 Tax=Oscillatoria acuminata PCC 6304 TaxID=56110 RepID=K9TDX3_9CYAN|nr:putative salt-induced outer membrane protein [Oscillatoria acuminata PCC 6304]